MSFIQKKKTATLQKTKEECKAVIMTVIDSGKLTDQQLNKIADLMQNDQKLQRALMFL